MASHHLGPSISYSGPMQQPLPSMQQQIINNFLGQFFKEQKDDARQMIHSTIHREVDIVMDRLFDQMRAQLCRMLSQPNMGPLMMMQEQMATVPDNNAFGRVVEGNQFNHQQQSFHQDALCSVPQTSQQQNSPPTSQVIGSNSLVHSMLSQQPANHQISSSSSHQSISHDSPNSYCSSQPQKSSIISEQPPQTPPQMKQQQPLVKIKEEIPEQFTVELDPFPLSQHSPPCKSDDYLECSQNSQVSDKKLSKSKDEIIAIKQEDDEDCDCYECISFALKREDDSEDSVQVIEDDEEDLCQNVDDDHSQEDRPTKRQRLIPEEDTSFDNYFDNQNSQFPSGSGVNVYSRAHGKRPFMFDPNHAHAQPPEGHQGILITLSVKCIVDNCDLNFINIPAMDQHLIDHHNILPNRCLLMGCNRSFFNRDQLSQHIRLEHSEVTKWQCGKCGSCCKNYNGLYQHTRWTHHDGHFKCAFANCHFGSENRGQVYRHYKQHYRDVSRSLDRTVPRQYVCPFEGCGKVFTENGNLRTHERIHLGIKPYRCRWPECNYASEHSSDTVKHIRIKHFNIPRTLKEQKERNIVETRNPRDFMEVMDDLLS